MGWKRREELLKRICYDVGPGKAHLPPYFVVEIRSWNGGLAPGNRFQVCEIPLARRTWQYTLIDKGPINDNDRWKWIKIELGGVTVGDNWFTTEVPVWCPNTDCKPTHTDCKPTQLFYIYKFVASSYSKDHADKIAELLSKNIKIEAEVEKTQELQNTLKKEQRELDRKGKEQVQSYVKLHNDLRKEAADKERKRLLTYRLRHGALRLMDKGQLCADKLKLQQNVIAKDKRIAAELKSNEGLNKKLSYLRGLNKKFKEELAGKMEELAGKMKELADKTEELNRYKNAFPESVRYNLPIGDHCFQRDDSKVKHPDGKAVYKVTRCEILKWHLDKINNGGGSKRSKTEPTITLRTKYTEGKWNSETRTFTPLRRRLPERIAGRRLTGQRLINRLIRESIRCQQS